MRFIIPFVSLLHGLAHLIGFVKAFQPQVLPQFTRSIEKPTGVGWLLTGLLFIVAGVMGLRGYPDPWLVLAFAIVLSQALILTTWADAKYGTIPNLILLSWAIVGYTSWNYHAKFVDDVTANLSQPAYFADEILTEQDLKPLPDPVQRYIRYTGAVGKPKVNNFRVDFTGKIRSKEQGVWMPFTSRQYNFLNTPTRLFFLQAVMMQLPVEGYHRYLNGSAVMDIRLLSLFRVQYADGPDMNVAETVTFFNDMCIMAPATLIDPRITWLDSDSVNVKASFRSNNITITATLFFNHDGQLINFESNDRMNAEENRRMRWTTPIKEYAEINGHRLGGLAETVYTYPTEDFSYGEFRMTNVAYNLKQPE